MRAIDIAALSSKWGNLVQTGNNSPLLSDNNIAPIRWILNIRKDRGSVCA